MILLLSLFGCAGVVDLGRATPLAPGQVQFSTGAAVTGVPSSANVTPVVGAGVHGGVAENLELGGDVSLHLYGLGGAVDAKIGLTPRERRGFHLALDPRVRLTGLRLGDSWPLGVAWSLELPVLLGWDLGRSQYVLAPAAGVSVGSTPQPYFAVATGVAIPVANWDVQPTAAVMTVMQSEAYWVVGYSVGVRVAVALE